MSRNRELCLSGWVIDSNFLDNDMRFVDLLDTKGALSIAVSITQSTGLVIEARGFEYLFRVAQCTNNMLEFLETEDKIVYEIDNETVDVKIDDYSEQYGRFLCKIDTDEGRYTMSTVQKKYSKATIRGFTTQDERYISPTLTICKELSEEVDAKEKEKSPT